MVDIDRTTCDLCGICVAVCASDAVSIQQDELYIENEACTTCLTCIPTCPTGSLREDK